MTGRSRAWGRSSVGAWQRRAICVGMDPNVFHPLSNLPHDPEVIHAKSICAACPVQEECKTHALLHRESGIWGGTTDRDREAIRRRERKARRAAAEA